MSEPETGYAESAGGSVGYQVVGTGPPDVLAAKPPFLPIDLMWDEPRLVRFLNGLSSFSRHIWFDARGTGSSGAIEPVEGRLIESVVDDMVAVLNECGCERAVVFEPGAGLSALQFAATHPERTSALVLIDPTARIRRADDYPEGVGLHTGEIELHSDDIGGIAVHIAQRVQSHAEPDEVLVSRTVADLVGGSGISFADRGVHALKGVPEQWQLYAVEDARVGSDTTSELG